MSNIYEGFKDVIGLAKEYEKRELYEKIVDLQARVNEIQQESIDKEKVINKKNKAIDELENKLRFKNNLIYDKDSNCYYSTNKDNSITGQPYCSRCWEKEKIAIHLVDDRNPRYKKCPECKTVYPFK